MAWNWELLAGPDTITEGPAWDGAGLLFTSIAKNEIRRFDPQSGTITTLYTDTNEANGLIFAPDGRLLACEGGGRAVVAYSPAGQKRTLVDRFEGHRLNSPNDLVLDGNGRIWFTDPRYGDDHSNRELDHDSVYRLTPPPDPADGWVIERMTFDTTRPNGLLLSPDERTLYVAQSDYVPTAKRELRAYPVSADGTLGNYRVAHDFGVNRGIDGMCFDTDGNIVATCGWELGGPGGRVTVFRPDGEMVEEQKVPADRPTNCVFGGPDLDVLYVTTIAGHLFRVANSGRRGTLKAPEVTPYTGPVA